MFLFDFHYGPHRLLLHLYNFDAHASKYFNALMFSNNEIVLFCTYVKLLQEYFLLFLEFAYLAVRYVVRYALRQSVQECVESVLRSAEQPLQKLPRHTVPFLKTIQVSNKCALFRHKCVIKVIMLDN